MDNQYRLVALANSELIAGLASLVRQNNLLTGQLLAHLVELEQRLLHLELGFSSLFSYCVEALGMSEGTAGRRVAAARVCRRFPVVFERVALGELHLCALGALAPHLSTENAGDLFDACRGKTRRQIEQCSRLGFRGRTCESKSVVCRRALQFRPLPRQSRFKGKRKGRPPYRGRVRKWRRFQAVTRLRPAHNPYQPQTSAVSNSSRFRPIDSGCTLPPMPSSGS